MRLFACPLMLLALIALAVAPAAGLVTYQARSEITVLGAAKPQVAVTRCWLASDRLRVESPTDLLIVRADRGVVWLADRKAGRYREFAIAALQQSLSRGQGEAKPVVPAPGVVALGKRQVNSQELAGHALSIAIPAQGPDKQQVPVTWQLELWVAAAPAEAANAYNALNARLAASQLPLLTLRAALVAADPQAHPVLLSYARATSALSGQLASILGLPMAMTVSGEVLTPGMERLTPEQRKLVAAEGGATSLLLVKSENTGLRIVPDDPSVFELPRGYKKAAD